MVFKSLHAQEELGWDLKPGLAGDKSHALSGHFIPQSSECPANLGGKDKPRTTILAEIPAAIWASIGLYPPRVPSEGD